MSKIPYNHKAIEKKWREKWEENPVNVQFDEDGNKKEKYYCLDMFPYPVRQRTARGTLERLRDLRRLEPLSASERQVRHPPHGWTRSPSGRRTTPSRWACIRPSSRRRT